MGDEDPSAHCYSGVSSNLPETRSRSSTMLSFHLIFIWNILDRRAENEPNKHHHRTEHWISDAAFLHDAPHL